MIAGYMPESKIPKRSMDIKMVAELKLKEEKLAIRILKSTETGERIICIRVTAKARAKTLITIASVTNCPIRSLAPAPETFRVAISLNLREVRVTERLM